jgi:hypothetical protein
MMSIPNHIELERLRYWQGQRLLARDFRDQRTIEAQLRWWHNRALHNAFGVSLGLAVTPVPAHGPLTAVRVNRGVAYDCFGRELILQGARELPVPAVPSQGNRMTLLIRYKETVQFPQRRDLIAICPPCGSSLWQEEPEFVWRSTTHLQVTDGVPLAQVGYDGQLAILNQEFTVPIARPIARPRIGSGATAPEGTAWEVWSERVRGLQRTIQETPVGMQVTVDTSTAGFTETPCYFAWLQGTLWSQSNIEFFPVPLTHLDSESTQQFRFRLWMPTLITLLGVRVRAANQNFTDEFVNFSRKQKLYVCWLGVQSAIMGVTGVERTAEIQSDCCTVNKG